MRKLDELALTAAAQAFAIAHYAARFGKDQADAHVRGNAGNNWQHYVADAEIYVRAYLAAENAESFTMHKHGSCGPTALIGRELNFLHPNPPTRQEALTLASEYFGTHPESWDHEGDGKPGIDLFSNALQVWAIQNTNAGRGPVTVAAAAEAFAADPRMIIAAVEHHYWMYLEGPDDDFGKLCIEHEGE